MMGMTNSVNFNFSICNTFTISGYGGLQLPPPPPMLVPHQINRNAKRAIAQASVQNTYNTYSSPVIAQPAVVSAKPTLYTAPTKTSASQSSVQSSVDFASLQSEVEKKLKKLKSEKVSAELAISQGKFSLFILLFVYAILRPSNYTLDGLRRHCLFT